MDYDTFLGEVQNRAQLPTTEDAVRITRITLETLSERIDPDGAENLGAQLPDEIGRYLSEVDDVERFSWGEFVGRIVDRGEYNQEDERASAVHHARVVMDVVDNAVSEGALDDVRTQLPDDEDWDELFALAEQEEKPVDADQRQE